MDDELSYDEQREQRRDTLIRQARSLGLDLNHHDVLAEDLDILFPDPKPKYVPVSDQLDLARDADAYLTSVIPPRNNHRNQIANVNEEPPLVRDDVFGKRVTNVINEDRAIRAHITDMFKDRLFQCASVQRLYITIRSWVMQKRVFRDVRHISDQLTRYGVTYISKSPDGAHETAVFSLDPYYHDKQAELAKRRARMEQHKTTRRVALAASRLSRLRVTFDKTSDEYIGGGSDDEDDTPESSGGAATSADRALSDASKRDQVEMIDLDEFPSYIDDHIRLNIAWVPHTAQGVALRGNIVDIYFTCHDIEE